ncbi:glycosyltransferase family 4 protein [Halomonas mongoliensis]|uniref:glycosyltransferase family 4 protein n=1 Tax=Halomonas mongoliensis TaxID=321265 RepID=UPI00403ACA05
MRSDWLRLHRKGWRRHGWRYSFLFLAARRWLDAGWYLGRYPDVAAAGMAPLAHFLLHGLAEGRDPSPWLSLGGQAWRRALVRPGARPWSPVRTLAHFALRGRRAPSQLAWVEGVGEQAPERGQPCLVVCAHSVAPRLFGAERSLLDVLRGLESLGVAAVVTVPNASHPGYLDELRRYSRAVVVLSYGWWQEGGPAAPATQQAFAEVLRRSRARAVYLNTLTLEAPALAARELGLPVITHVREIPTHDPALCAALGAGPEGVLARAAALADLLVANSAFTARALLERGREVCLVPNTLDLEAWRVVAPPPGEGEGEQGRPLRIGLLGSLVPRKGIEGLAQVADRLAERGVVARCVLYGAATPELEALLAQREQEGAPGCLGHAGYVEDPRQALAELDVVVNFSHFEESFGRTLLEAMAAGRPVVAYARGALPELVDDGESGFLVPFGDCAAAAERLARLAGDPALRLRMGRAARRRAERFGEPAFVAALGRVLEKIADVPDQR